MSADQQDTPEATLTPKNAAIRQTAFDSYKARRRTREQKIENTDLLNPARLAEIRVRADIDGGWSEESGRIAASDRRHLLAEVDRLTTHLTAERERREDMTREARLLGEQVERRVAEVRDLRARVQRVEAECDAEERSEGFADGKPVNYPFPAFVSTRRVRAALAGDTEAHGVPDKCVTDEDGKR